MFENEQYATILYNKIICISKYYKANLFSFCIMPDHLHIMIKFAKENDISFYMRDLKSLFVKEIREKFNFETIFWGKRFYDQIINNENHYNNIEIYIKNNYIKYNLLEKYKTFPYFYRKEEHFLWVRV